MDCYKSLHVKGWPGDELMLCFGSPKRGNTSGVPTMSRNYQNYPDRYPSVSGCDAYAQNLTNRPLPYPLDNPSYWEHEITAEDVAFIRRNSALYDDKVLEDLDLLDYDSEDVI